MDEIQKIQDLETQAIASPSDITHILNTMFFLTRQFLKEEESYFDNLHIE